MSSQVDVVIMYHTACAFSDCADFYMREQNAQTNLLPLYINPVIVNAAFSCEVFLKLLLYLEEIPYEQQHKLNPLFEMLPSEIRDEIKRRTIQKYGRWTDLFGTDILSQVSDSFVEWRYLYEYDWKKSVSVHLDLSFLLAFRDSLKDVSGKRLEGML